MRVLSISNGRAEQTDPRSRSLAAEPVAISDGHALANGGTLPGSSPTSDADALPPGGRACADASGSALRLREEGAEATNPALIELAAVVTDGGAPADGGSPKGADLTPAADSPKGTRAGAGAGAAAAAAAADQPMPTAAPLAPSGNGARGADPTAPAAPPVLPQRDLLAPRQGAASPAATDQPPAVTHLAAQR